MRRNGSQNLKINQMKNPLFSLLAALSITFLVGCTNMVPEDGLAVRKTMSKGDTLHLFTVENSTRNYQTKDDKIYHSFRFGKIIQTQGIVNGKALSGMYEQFYKKKPIIKGEFKKGLKEGKWYSWSLNGNLTSLIEYKRGIIQGSFKQYDDSGKLMSNSHYKNGLRDGITEVIEEDYSIFLKYKKGLVVDTLESEPKLRKLMLKR